MRNVIAYIDGFNLYNGIREKYGKKFLWLDLQSLCRKYLKNDQSLFRVKYFTARLTGCSQSKVKRQSKYIDAVNNCEILSVIEGVFYSKMEKCYECGYQWIGHDEKGTDVNIAVNLIEDAYHDRFQTAFLISGDSDLASAVDFVKRRYADTKNVVCIFPPNRTSKHLQQITNSNFKIHKRTLERSLQPDPVRLSNGIELTKPSQWV